MRKRSRGLYESVLELIVPHTEDTRMLRFVTMFTAMVAVTLAAPGPNPMNVFRIDISPEEAQQYLNSPPFHEPQLSGRNNVLPLVRYDSPQFREASAGPTLGHYWKNGHEIENVDDYVEEVYDASQFHGQDGLGAYGYGYRTPESSKIEDRQRSGEVQGSYTYKTNDNQDIKVRYWADSEGFHQEDNLPKVELRPVQEAEDVRQARLAHEKAWQEAAAAAAQQPDPQGEYNPEQYENQGAGSAPQVVQLHGNQQQGGYQLHGQYQRGYQPTAAHQGQDYQSAPSEQQQVSVAAPSGNQNQNQPREGKAYSSAQASFQSQPQKYNQQGQYQQNQYQSGQQKVQQGSYGQQSSQYSQSPQYGQQNSQSQYSQQNQEPEPTGPPRGFFYSFDYPVSIIARKDAQGQTGPVHPGNPIDHDTVGVNTGSRIVG